MVPLSVLQEREDVSESRFVQRTAVFLFAFLFTLATAFVLFFQMVSPAYADSGEGRHVYVVFDDSTSMVGENGAWCDAQYALECFVAMLGENDELTIYPMSAYTGADFSADPTTYYGSDDAAANVESIRRGDFLRENNKSKKVWDADTVFKAAEVAYGDMKSNLGESRLIILTDGAFCQVSNETSYDSSYTTDYGSTVVSSEKIAKDIDGELQSWASSGANIYYLALGVDAPTELLPSEATGLTVKQCANNDEIIQAVIDSCNWAFKRASLSDYMDSGATTIPVKKVVVFAQGENSSQNTAPNADSIVDVKYPELPSNSAASSNTSAPNQSLNSTISTADNGGEGYQIGDSSFGDLVSDGNTEVYFEPNAVIDVSLVDGDGWKYDTSGDEINLKAGDGYTAEFTLCDPDTGEDLSELLDGWDIDCGAELEIEGQDPVTITEGEPFNVSEGSGHLTTKATLTDVNSGAQVEFSSESRTVVSTPKTILDWILHYIFLLPLLLLIILAIVAALIFRKHLNAPRLPEDLYPELYDSYNGTKPSTLVVEAFSKNTPFFGAETQCFDLIVKSPYRSLVMPPSIIVRATDKQGNMVIDNWDEVIEFAKQGEKDCVKLGSKKVAECKPEDPAVPLTTGSRMKFLGTHSGDEVLIELRFKQSGRRRK